MIWLGVGASLLLAIALVVRRREMAEMQSLVIGGRLTPGCVLLQAALLFAVAILGVGAFLAGWIR